jgi:hypothetical protein
MLQIRRTKQDLYKLKCLRIAQARIDAYHMYAYNCKLAHKLCVQSIIWKTNLYLLGQGASYAQDSLLDGRITAAAAPAGCH